VQEYRPKVVCIEFNPTIPTEVDFVQERDPTTSQGCSLKALYRLAKERGYQAVCVLPWNAVFVDANSGYDGSIHFQGAKKLPWHGIPLDESSIKAYPSCCACIRTTIH
jgi:hypothetical protein